MSPAGAEERVPMSCWRDWCGVRAGSPPGGVGPQEEEEDKEGEGRRGGHLLVRYGRFG